MFDYCKFPRCGEQLVNDGLCSGCFEKVFMFEEIFDRWLETNFPMLYLEDVIGWYTICINNPCRRDCLEETFPIIIGCNCCPHQQVQSYNSIRIDNKILPTREWISENILSSREWTDENISLTD